MRAAFLIPDQRQGKSTPPPPPPPPPPPAGQLTQAKMPTYEQAWTLATAPTLSYAAAPTLTGPVLALTDPRVALSGGATRGLVAGTASGYLRPPYMANAPTPDVEFESMWAFKVRSTATSFEVKFRQRSNLSGGGVNTRFPIRVKINGQWVTRRPIYVGPGNIGFAAPFTPSAISAGTNFSLKFTFASAADREVEVFSMAEVAGVQFPSGFSDSSILQATTAGYRAVVLGDSIFGGEKNGTGNFSLSSQEGSLQHATYTHLSSMWSYMCQTIGYDNVINSGVGSSGFEVSGDTVKYSAQARMANDVVAHNPGMVVIGSSFNDLQAGISDATVQATATAMLKSLRTSLPNAILVLFGNPTPPIAALLTNGNAKIASANLALKAAALAGDAWFLDPTLGNLYDTKGVLKLDGPNMITGNTQYISSDQTHPTQAGADFFGSGFLATALKLVHPLGTVNPPPPPPPTGTYGPVSVGETKYTLPRDQRADREFTAASLKGLDVRSAMLAADAWMVDNPTKWADVILPDGDIVAFGSGSSKSRWLTNGLVPANEVIGRNIPNTADRHYVRIRPGGGFGAVKIAQHLAGKPITYDYIGNIVGTASPAFRNVFGFTLSEIDANDVSFSVMDSQMSFEYIGNLAAWNTYWYAGTFGEVELQSIYYAGGARVKNSDWGGLSGAEGAGAADVRGLLRLTNAYGQPIRVAPKDENGNAWTPKTKPHSDLIQAKFGGQLRMEVKRSFLPATQNTTIQFGSNLRADLEDSLIVGGEQLLLDWFPTPKPYLTGESPVFGAFNAPGLGNNTSRRTFVQGGMQVATWANTPADVLTSTTSADAGKVGWTKVPQKTLAQLQAMVGAPPDGYKLWATR